MSQNIIFLFLVIILFGFGNSAFAQVQLLDVKWHGNIVETDSMTISEEAKSITILSSGLVTGRIDNEFVEFTLPLEKDFHVASVDWAETDSVHIILYQESIGTHMSTNFIIIDKESFAVSEKESAGGFNFRKPIFKNQYMYLRSIGTVGKYDLKNRTYSWVFSDLYDRERGTFNIIEKPIFENGIVTFISRDDFNGNVDTLRIDDDSGVILKGNE